MESQKLQPFSPPPVSDLYDPLDRVPIGDTKWLSEKTGWAPDKIARLCRRKAIPGSFQAVPGARGACWSFRKAKVIAWLESLEA